MYCFELNSRTNRQILHKREVKDPVVYSNGKKFSPGARTSIAAKAQKGEGSREDGSASTFSTQSSKHFCSLKSLSTAG